MLKSICIGCKKNKSVKDGYYCSVCYRKLKIPSECMRCSKIRVTVKGLCLPCYNYKMCGYRAEALKVFENKCSNKNCYLKSVDVPVDLLDVDHINGDRKNDSIDNLQVLCVLCHAIKTRKVIPSF